MAKEFNEEGFSITENETVYDGQNSKIESVTLSKGSHSVDLLRKKFRGYSIEFMDSPKWHDLLKKKGGYPILPTLRYDAQNGVEYITDLRRGGTHRVIDFCGDESNFKEVYVSNLEKLEDEVDKLLNKSADDGLIINEPNIFFDVEVKTGVTKVLLGELRELGYRSIDLSIDDKSPSRKEIFDHNSWILKEHMDRLKRIMTIKKPSL